jgi:hypothetical protein
MNTRKMKRRAQKANPLGLIPEATAARVYLRVCERTLQRERRAGRIQYFRVGIRIYYNEQQIISYLERHKSAPLSQSVQAA